MADGRTLTWNLFTLLALAAIPPAAADEATTEPELAIIVMDPLAAPLSCPCVQGYAQRDYEKLAAHLRSQLGRSVNVYFDESLPRALAELTDGRADLVIGKDSVVRHDAAKAGRKFKRIALLSGKEGTTTQHGLIVVRAADPARRVADLRGYRIIFGPEESYEKHGAILELLRAQDVSPPAELETRQGCDEGATLILEMAAEERGAAVISSYARPLLEGCGTVPKGALRVVGKTPPVPFIGAFVSAELDPSLAGALSTALESIVDDPELMKALETKAGFVPAADEAADSAAPKGTPAAAPAVNETGWTGWRGPGRDGRVASLPASLPASARPLWRRPLSRPGMGGLAATERMVIVSDRDPSDKFDIFRCLDADSGAQRWMVRYPAEGRLDYGNSPRATPCIAAGRAFLLGAFGHLHCVDLAQGRVVWKRDLRSDFAVDDELVWGMAASPLLIDGRLIVNPGGPRASLVALDPSTGAVMWRSAGEPAAFASFVPAVLGGRSQIVGYDKASLGGWDPATGARLWRLLPPVEGDFNVPTPIVDGAELIISTENNGTRRHRFAAGGQIEPGPIAENADLAPDTHTPVLAGRRLVGVWGRLMCLDADDGLRPRWQSDASAFAGYVTLVTDGSRVLALSQEGELVLFDAQADAYRPDGSLRLFEDDSGVYSHPAFVGSRLYARGSREVVCLDLTSEGGE